MTTEAKRHYEHLEARPGSNYRQLFLKGRRIRADMVYQDIHGPDGYTPEQWASNYGIPLEAVLEALDYVERNQPIIQADRARDEARHRAEDQMEGRSSA